MADNEILRRKKMCSNNAFLLFVVITCFVTFVNTSGDTNRDSTLARGDNGGISCATCTILLSITSQLAEIYNETTPEALSRMCTYLPKNYQSECDMIVQLLSPIITSEIDFSPDMICYTINLCYVEEKMCHLFPLPSVINDIHFHASWSENRFKHVDLLREKLIKSFPWICYLPGTVASWSRKVFWFIIKIDTIGHKNYGYVCFLYKKIRIHIYITKFGI